MTDLWEWRLRTNFQDEPVQHSHCCSVSSISTVASIWNNVTRIKIDDINTVSKMRRRTQTHTHTMKTTVTMKTMTMKMTTMKMVTMMTMKTTKMMTETKTLKKRRRRRWWQRRKHWQKRRRRSWWQQQKCWLKRRRRRWQRKWQQKWRRKRGRQESDSPRPVSFVSAERGQADKPGMWISFLLVLDFTCFTVEKRVC